MFYEENEYWEFIRTIESSFTTVISSSKLGPCRLQASGSLARGEVRPPYSDIDLVVVASEGEGRRVRDLMPKIARSVGKLLTIFADPFSSESVFNSIYSGPVKVDWFVSESKKETGSGTKQEKRIFVWNGTEPQPYDWESHPWDWLWWLWCKYQNKKYNLVCNELPKLWQFLRLHNIDISRFPSLVPDPNNSTELGRLLIATMEILPKSNQELAYEISHAITTSRNVHLY